MAEEAKPNRAASPNATANRQKSAARARAAKAQPGKNKGGRPPAMVADEKTLAELKKLGGMHATMEEIAGWFEVSRTTLTKFLNENEKARDMIDFGKAGGKLNLRRLQFRSAERSITMQIWLGKQLLGQTDKIEEKVEQNTTIDVISDAATTADRKFARLIASKRAELGKGGTLVGQPH